MVLISNYNFYFKRRRRYWNFAFILQHLGFCLVCWYFFLGVISSIEKLISGYVFLCNASWELAKIISGLHSEDWPSSQTCLQSCERLLSRWSGRCCLYISLFIKQREVKRCEVGRVSLHNSLFNYSSRHWFMSGSQC